MAAMWPPRVEVPGPLTPGSGATAIEKAWSGVSMERAGTLDDAVARAFAAAREADGPRVVLLSPGCASFEHGAGSPLGQAADQFQSAQPGRCSAREGIA